MKSFLLKGKKPIVKWGMIPDNTFYKGKVPRGYSLAVTPSIGYIVIDVDKHGSQNGFDAIPKHLQKELNSTFSYNTKNNGKHYWFKYSGEKVLANKTSGLGIDLRTHKGYVVWYPSKSVKKSVKKAKNTSDEMNKWLEKLFSYV